MARVVVDGPNLHLLPIVTRGATENLNSLLYLRGVDTVIINSDALEEYKIQVPKIQRRITYLLNFFPFDESEIDPEIDVITMSAATAVDENDRLGRGEYAGLIGRPCSIAVPGELSLLRMALDTIVYAVERHSMEKERARLQSRLKSGPHPVMALRGRVICYVECPPSRNRLNRSMQHRR
jgi:hypothetical protein